MEIQRDRCETKFLIHLITMGQLRMQKTMNSKTSPAFKE